MKKLFFSVSLFAVCLTLGAQKVDYSYINVPEESGLGLMQITSDNDCVCQPVVKRTSNSIGWVSNRVVDVTPDGLSIAFISVRGATSNIFIKDLGHRGGAVQRTNRSLVQDFSFSHDGSSICFSETTGSGSNIFVTDAKKGFVCREITSGARDYSPVYSLDQKHIFFCRMEGNVTSIWSYDMANKFLSNYSPGVNPVPASSDGVFYCVRFNGFGRGEIYKNNYVSGVDECVVSDTERTFSSPQLSPDGQWIVFVGSNRLQYGRRFYWNTDIFVCKVDGTDFMQLTYHAGDDLAPVWDKSGKYIYFISQRGNENGTANIWRMNFNLK